MYHLALCICSACGRDGTVDVITLSKDIYSPKSQGQNPTWEQTLANAGIPDKPACIHVVVSVATTTVLVDIRPDGHVPWSLNDNLTSDGITVMVQI